MFCKYCGNEVAEGTKYCSFCGGNLSETASADNSVSGSNTGKEITINSDGLAKVIGLAFTLIFAFYFLRNFFTGIGNIFSLGTMLRLDAEYALFSFVLAVLTSGMGLVSALLAAMGVFVFKYPGKEKLKSIFVVTEAIGCLAVIVVMVKVMFIVVAKSVIGMLTGVDPLPTTTIVYLLLVFAFIGALYGILQSLGEKPNLAFQNMKEALNEIGKMAREFTGGNGKKQLINDNMSQIQTGITNSIYTQGAGMMVRYTNQSRGLLTFGLLYYFTCGFYEWFFVHEMSQDLNAVCAGDGEETAGLLKYILLCIVTCGIYRWYWYYKVGNRIARNGTRYGFVIVENGTSVLIWFIFGYLLCGLGWLVGMNIVLKNSNMICQAYNTYISQNTYQ